MLVNIERTLLRRSFTQFVEGAWHLLEDEGGGQGSDVFDVNEYTGVEDEGLIGDVEPSPYPHDTGDDKSYKEGGHVRLIGRHLEAVKKGEISRLLINLPPSHTKSTLISVMFPAWVWTSNRTAKFLCQTYSKDLTLRDAAVCRRIITSKWYTDRWPWVRPLKDDNAKTYYRLRGGGWRLSTTVSGRATGEHPDYVICDDALSAKDGKIRARCSEWEDWYQSTISTRGYMRGVRHVIAHQRVGYYDSSHVALKQNEEDKLEGKDRTWHHVMLPLEFDPARAMEDRGYGGDWRKEKGELLFPEMVTPETAEQLKRNLGTDANRKAQLDQNPDQNVSTALRMENMKYIQKHEVPECDLWCRFIDKAATEDGGCRTALVLVGMKAMGNDVFNYFIKHVHKGQWGDEQVEAEISKTAISDEAKLGSKEKYIVGVEREGGSGGVLSVNVTKRRNRAFDVIDLPPVGDKMSRAHALQTSLGFGEVYCVQDTWTPEYTSEMTDAPNSEFMDQFDATNGAISVLNEEYPKRKTKRVIMAGLDPDSCATNGCDRPVGPGRKYCCDKCEGAAGFDDPELIATLEHTNSCRSRSKRQELGIT